MPAKQKKGRSKGKTVNLNEFAENFIADDNYDWAEEAWSVDDIAENRQTEQRGHGGRGGHREYSRTANNRLGEGEGFRDAPEVRAREAIDFSTLEPPFVAHFGNLRNGITKEELEEQFHDSAVMNTRLINRDTKTFAFIEFTTVNALQAAIAMDGSMILGRRVRANVASTDQVERMQNRGRGRGGMGSPGFSRDEAGQAQTPFGHGQMDFDRNNFGEQQPVTEEFQGRAAFGRRGGREGEGQMRQSNSLANMDRDFMGTGQQPQTSDSAQGISRGAFGQQAGASSPPPNLSGWRDGAAAEQPEVAAIPRNPRSFDSFDRSNMRGGKNNDVTVPDAPAQEAGSPNAPSPFAAMSNWRDEPITTAPPPAAPAAEGAAPAVEGEGEKLGSPNSNFRGGGNGPRNNREGGRNYQNNNNNTRQYPPSFRDSNPEGNADEKDAAQGGNQGRGRGRGGGGGDRGQRRNFNGGERREGMNRRNDSTNEFNPNGAAPPPAQPAEAAAGGGSDRWAALGRS